MSATAWPRHPAWEWATVPAGARPTDAPPVKTVVILVHGHNEYEKLGDAAADVEQP
jgi:hypothetical protein